MLGEHCSPTDILGGAIAPPALPPLSCLNYTTTGEATSGSNLTQRESHVQESCDNNKKVGGKPRIDEGGSEEPEI